MTVEKCPICQTPSEKIVFSEGGARITCPQCGIFSVTSGFNSFSEDRKDDRKKYKNDIHNIQGFLRLRSEQFNEKERNVKCDKILTLCIKSSKKPHDTEEFYYMTLEEILETGDFPKTLSEKIDKLLWYLSWKSKGTMGKDLSLQRASDFPLAFARSSEEFRFLISSMDEHGFFQKNLRTSDSTSEYFVLSLHAWERIEEIQEKNKNSKQGFVACWFHKDHDLFRKTIEEGIATAGFSPMSIKERHYPETIMAKALGEIRKSRFVIIDLTEQRNTVFVEMGFAMGLGIETILVISKKYWKENKKDLEYYSSNYSIKMYEDKRHLKEIIETSIAERIAQ